MILKAIISTVEDGRYRVLVDGQQSSLMAIMMRSDAPMELEPGDEVIIVIWHTLADGIILGKVDKS